MEVENNSLKEKDDNKTNSFEKGLDKVNTGFLNFIHRFDLIIYFVIITILAVVMRLFLLPKVSGDYNILTGWYVNIYENGFSALGSQQGDYTPAYNYILYFISLFRFKPGVTYILHILGGEYVVDPILFSIKTISILFDFGMAIFVYFITKKLTNSKTKSVLAYTLTVFGLTVFLNSSLWGQCDSIYGFFIVGSIYYLLKKQHHISFIMLSLAFCFKLQAIFVLPVYIILYLKKMTKLRYFLYIPLMYFIFALPASIAALDNFSYRLGQIFLVYFNQAARSYKQVSLNAGTFYTLIFTNFKEEQYISYFAVFLALAVNGTLIFFFMRTKAKLNNNLIVKMFLIFMMTMPYFMPHMHDRYYYLADVFVIVYVMINVKKFYIAIMAILNSMIGYMVYLWNVPFINVVPQDGSIADSTKALSFRFGSIVYLVAIIIVLIDFFKDLELNTPKEENQIQEQL